MFPNILDCTDGMFGIGCATPCNCHGSEVCGKQTGSCGTCAVGFTGSNCKDGMLIQHIVRHIVMKKIKVKSLLI